MNYLLILATLFFSSCHSARTKIVPFQELLLKNNFILKSETGYYQYIYHKDSIKDINTILKEIMIDPLKFSLKRIPNSIGDEHHYEYKTNIAKRNLKLIIECRRLENLSLGDSLFGPPPPDSFDDLKKNEYIFNFRVYIPHLNKPS